MLFTYIKFSTKSYISQYSSRPAISREIDLLMIDILIFDHLKNNFAGK